MGHLTLVCPWILQLEHVGGARLGVLEGRDAESIIVSSILFPGWFLWCIRSLASCTDLPSFRVIWHCDRRLFSLFFSFSERSSWFSLVKKAALYNAISQPFIICWSACFEGVQGLWEPLLSSFLTDEACFCSWQTVWGVARAEEVVEVSPPRPPGGDGVIIIWSYSSTLQGLNGRIPAAVKLFWIFWGLKISWWAVK